MDCRIMYTYELSQRKYPNLTVEDRFWNGKPAGWRVTAKEGYVMYDSADATTELDIKTGKEVPVTYYFTMALLPGSYRWDRFPWVAVHRDDIR